MHHVSSSYQHVAKVLVIINHNTRFSHRLSYQPVNWTRVRISGG